MSERIVTWTDATGFHHFEQLDAYCERCGCYSVWIPPGEGDYYHGPETLCHECGSHGGYSANEKSMAEAAELKRRLSR